jgi:hypothetical protein
MVEQNRREDYYHVKFEALIAVVMKRFISGM